MKPNTITDIIKPELPTLEALLLLNNENTAVQTIALQELNYLEQHALANPWIIDVAQNAPQTIVLAIKNVLRKNLSLDPSAGLVYIKKRNLKVNVQGVEKWVTILETQETANGLLSYNRQIGTIYDYTDPQVKKDDKGKVIGVSMQVQKPGYRGEPRWELFEYDESDFLRWKTYSHRENGKNKNDANAQTLNYANKLYTSWIGGIDKEFAKAKCIRHSLKKLGSNPNEVIGHFKNTSKPLPINADIAQAEAMDNDQDYTAHEELNSSLNTNNNEDHSTGNPINPDEYNPDDM